MYIQFECECGKGDTEGIRIHHVQTAFIRLEPDHFDRSKYATHLQFDWGFVDLWILGIT